MKSAVLLTCSIIFVFLVSMELSVIDDIGLATKNQNLSLQQNTVDRSPSLLTTVKENLQKTISLVNHEGKEDEDAPTPPFTLLLLTGLFGFAFWGRTSSRSKQYSAQD